MVKVTKEEIIDPKTEIEIRRDVIDNLLMVNKTKREGKDNK